MRPSRAIVAHPIDDRFQLVERRSRWDAAGRGIRHQNFLSTTTRSGRWLHAAHVDAASHVDAAIPLPRHLRASNLSTLGTPPHARLDLSVGFVRPAIGAAAKIQREVIAFFAIPAEPTATMRTLHRHGDYALPAADGL
jgi:hypothetical protein